MSNDFIITMPTFMNYGQQIYTTFKMLEFDENVGNFLTNEDEFSIEKINDHYQVNLYSARVNETRSLFHYHKNTHVKIKDFYKVLISSIRNEFAEQFI